MVPLADKIIWTKQNAKYFGIEIIETPDNMGFEIVGFDENRDYFFIGEKRLQFDKETNKYLMDGFKELQVDARDLFWCAYTEDGKTYVGVILTFQEIYRALIDKTQPTNVKVLKGKLTKKMVTSKFVKY